MLEAAERGVSVCSECQVRWNGAGEEVEAEWLVYRDGAGALTMFCRNARSAGSARRLALARVGFGTHVAAAHPR